MIPYNFLSVTPYERLPDIIRYLDGIQYRVDHLQGKVGKDETNVEVLKLWSARYARLEEIGEKEDELVRLRFLLEEYRVALFSQTVGTREKVSEKRLEREFASVEMSVGLR